MCRLIRSVRRSRWIPQGNTPVLPEFVENASADLTPRPSDNGGLSVYQIHDDPPDQAEEHLTAALHVVLTRKPLTVHFLRIQPACIRDLDLEIRHEFSTDQHPYLQHRHRNIYGITPEISRQIAHSILSGDPYVLTITEGEIRQQGRRLLDSMDFAGHIAFPEAYR